MLAHIFMPSPGLVHHGSKDQGISTVLAVAGLDFQGRRQIGSLTPPWEELLLCCLIGGAPIHQRRLKAYVCVDMSDFSSGASVVVIRPMITAVAMVGVFACVE
ncbi:hypothetical protein Nepgr_026570 [Nepenthes gracilis]|uniref:Uncharacterized protein n=1 Tax=Nepenthes gracilis TaxID=150966 RepID=A0AAD3T8H6_NEPGR|nr:hypothetical protein Nepgr_026570 [Nepenthes gracilis]